MSFIVKINAALAKIGKFNGTAAPESQDPLDKVAHYYGVSSIGASYYEKQKKADKDALTQALNPASHKKIAKAIQQTVASGVGDNIEVGRGQFYTVMLKIGNGASYLDETALRVELLKKMKTDDVDKLFDSCRKRRDPTLSYTVVENSE